MRSPSSRVASVRRTIAICASSERRAKYACVVRPAIESAITSRAWRVASACARAASEPRRSRPQKSISNDVEAESLRLFETTALRCAVRPLVRLRDPLAPRFTCGRKFAPTSRITASASSTRAAANSRSALRASAVATSASRPGSPNCFHQLLASGVAAPAVAPRSCG